MRKEANWTSTIDHRLEPLTTILMALAALLTAWSSYQSTLWSSRNNALYADAATAKREASRLDIRANQTFQIDWSVFQAYQKARLNGDAEIAEFYAPRLPPRLARPFREWETLAPERNPQAPPHPFALPSYVIPDTVEAEKQMNRGLALDAQARDASRHSARYTRTTVAFALVLFFSGLAPRGSRRASRLLMLATAGAVLAAAGAQIATLPVAMS